jgi:tetratricopeptide (TPR) repeat protein
MTRMKTLYLRVAKYILAVSVTLASYAVSALADSSSYEKELSSGFYYFNSQNFESAVFHFTNAIKDQPDSDRAYFNRGVCYVHLHEHQKALKDYEKAISLAPQNSLYHSVRARLYDSMHEDKLALADDEQALRLAPRDAVVISTVAMLRLKAGRIDEAKELFTKAIAIEPRYNDYYQLAELARKEGNSKLADDYMKKARSCPANGRIGQPGDPIDPNPPVAEFPPKSHRANKVIHYKNKAGDSAKYVHKDAEETVGDFWPPNYRNGRDVAK